MTHSDSPAADASLGRFLTLADTAEVLNISASQAYALVRSGELPAIKVGGHGHWRVERLVLESYIEAKYEESRRLSLWQQSDYASLAEHSFGDRNPGGTSR
jgi:excisionase family DNA binding protein